MKLSFVQGKGSQLHNRRDYDKIGKDTPSNIDLSKSEENITLIDIDIKKAYEDMFGDSVRDYNSKQKRDDRKIKSYYDKVAKSKNGEKLFYEDVIQVGSMEDFKNGQSREICRDVLVDYVRQFESNNPNLKLVGAYIHMDEASPHLHLDYIPVATGYKKGLSKRNSLTKALKEQGVQTKSLETRSNNVSKAWKEQQRGILRGICLNHGISLENEQKSDRKHLSVDEYKQIKDSTRSKILEKAHKERLELEKEIFESKWTVSELNADTARLKAEKQDLYQSREELKEEFSQLEKKIEQKRDEIRIPSPATATMEYLWGKKEVDRVLRYGHDLGGATVDIVDYMGHSIGKKRLNQFKEELPYYTNLSTEIDDQLETVRKPLSSTEYVRMPKSTWQKYKSKIRSLEEHDQKLVNRFNSLLSFVNRAVKEVFKKVSKINLTLMKFSEDPVAKLFSRDDERYIKSLENVIDEQNEILERLSSRTVEKPTRKKVRSYDGPDL